MVSRERLLRFGERPAVRILGRLLAGALVVLLALRLWQLWRRHPVDFAHTDGGVFAAAVVASVVAVTAYGLVWPFLLRRLGTPVSFSWIGLFFKGQLGKYLPGSVWQYAGRVSLARSRGVPAQRAFVSVVAEVAYSAIAAALASSLLLGSLAGTSIILGSVALLALVFALRRASPLLAAGPPATGLYLAVWGLYGLAFWTTGRALFAVPVSELPRYIGVFALGWLAGLVAVFAPGGIGVREAVIAALLSTRLGQADAIVLAAVSRIVLSAVDLAAAAGALWMPALLRVGSRPVGARR
jgi:uncharacterized membrane protein YbhN (UPF0104 family)